MTESNDSKRGRIEPLKSSEACWRCDPEALGFKSTEELAGGEGAPPEEGVSSHIIGQERALRALDFGLGIQNHGYNIFVLGDTGTGKSSSVISILEERAEGETVPDDWCYVNNFDDMDKPKAMRLPPTYGLKFALAMDNLVSDLKRDIPKVFESKDYEEHKEEVFEGQQKLTSEIFAKLESVVKKEGFILKKSASGVSIHPADEEGKAIKQKDFDEMEAGKREKMEETLRRLQSKLSDAIREARNAEKGARERVKALDREMLQYVLNPMIEEIKSDFHDFEEVVEYLDEVKEDVIERIDDFRPKEEAPVTIPLLRGPEAGPSYDRYIVNLLVDNKDTVGAPVVFEKNPTYYNLFGRLEYQMEYGVASTDFTMIRGGSIHRANGGYLVIDALDMLRNIFVYDAIKRVIKSKEIAIEDVWEQYRLVTTTTMRPDPILVDVKVVIIGEPYIYYLLHTFDSEYKKMFKVKADFDNEMENSSARVDDYSRFIATHCRDEELLPFDSGGVARVVEYGVRLAGDKDKLASRFNEIRNLLVESSYWASVRGGKSVAREDVEVAIVEWRKRHSKVPDRIREFMERDVLMIDTTGEVVGQINGMAVLNMGDFAFGTPSRITAKTYMGDRGVVNIEREVKMSGRIHNKALMILTSLLGERFARTFPLTLSASICFEQLYDEVEGDSATCTEFYALISSITGLPIDQGIAVTGSMNQLGEVQPIGGVNEKIEGFFDLCVKKGFKGGEGVIIPARNVRNLMLKDEILEAIDDGRFSIYPISQVDDGFEILMKREGGTLQGEEGGGVEGGNYPPGTVNYLAQERLRGLAKGLRAFGKPKVKVPAPPGEEGEENNNDTAGKDDDKKLPPEKKQDND